MTTTSRFTVRRGLVAATAAAGLVIPLVATTTHAGSPARAATAAGSGCGKWMNAKQSPTKRADELLEAMTTAQKLQMLHQNGTDMEHYGVAGYVPALPALCIPALLLNDAGSGLGDGQTDVTAYPAAISQAASFDPSLQKALGKSLGGESAAKGINILLAPDVNIARVPLNGRTSEAYGEDPLVAGRTAAAFIKGVQSRHVIATVKHYEGNNQETNRGTVDSIISKRTLEEIYHRPFRAAVQQGHVGAVMCSYNRINGPYACQSKAMLRHDLDGEMGFKGFVMSDWGATHSTIKSVKNGLDMEMGVYETAGDEQPMAAGGINFAENYYNKPLTEDVAAHKVAISAINGMVRRILRSMFAIGLFDHPAAAEPAAYTANVDTAANQAVARKAAQAGTVLLKNSGATLPITGKNKTIAVIGADASTSASQVAQAGGSVHVVQPNVVTPLSAITSRAATDGDTVTYNDGSDPAAAAAVAQSADVAIVDVGYVEAEGADLKDFGYTSGVCELTCATSPTNANALVDAVAAANPHTVVVLNTGGPAQLPWLSKVRSVLEAWYPGEQDGNALAPLLFGDASPGGHLPLTFPKSLKQLPTHTAKQWPGVGGKAHYSEGLLVGYRWYDAKHKTPYFPFGYGLTYTKFRMTHLRPHTGRSGVRITLRVKNTGSRAAAQVVQVYVHDPKASHEPPQQLAGYHRVTLKSGQTKTVTIRLSNRQFAHYSTKHHGWSMTKGCYTLKVGNSSRHETLHTKVGRGGAHCKA